MVLRVDHLLMWGWWAILKAIRRRCDFIRLHACIVFGCWMIPSIGRETEKRIYSYIRNRISIYGIEQQNTYLCKNACPSAHTQHKQPDWFRFLAISVCISLKAKFPIECLFVFYNSNTHTTARGIAACMIRTVQCPPCGWISSIGIADAHAQPVSARDCMCVRVRVCVHSGTQTTVSSDHRTSGHRWLFRSRRRRRRWHLCEPRTQLLIELLSLVPAEARQTNNRRSNMFIVLHTRAQSSARERATVWCARPRARVAKSNRTHGRRSRAASPIRDVICNHRRRRRLGGGASTCTNVYVRNGTRIGSLPHTLTRKHVSHLSNVLYAISNSTTLGRRGSHLPAVRDCLAISSVRWWWVQWRTLYRVH